MQVSAPVRTFLESGIDKLANMPDCQDRSRGPATRVAGQKGTPGALFQPQGPPGSAWPGRLAGLTRGLDRQASKIKLNFVTIGSPGLGNESPLRGPKLPHGLSALPRSSCGSLPCMPVRVPLILMLAAGSMPSPPSKVSPLHREKNPPGN